jgi:hypothetical protein
MPHNASAVEYTRSDVAEKWKRKSDEARDECERLREELNQERLRGDDPGLEQRSDAWVTVYEAIPSDWKDAQLGCAEAKAVAYVMLATAMRPVVKAVCELVDAKRVDMPNSMRVDRAMLATFDAVDAFRAQGQTVEAGNADDRRALESAADRVCSLFEPRTLAAEDWDGWIGRGSAADGDCAIDCADVTDRDLERVHAMLRRAILEESCGQ